MTLDDNVGRAKARDEPSMGVLAHADRGTGWLARHMCLEEGMDHKGEESQAGQVSLAYCNLCLFAQLRGSSDNLRFCSASSIEAV